MLGILNVAELNVIQLHCLLHIFLIFSLSWRFENVGLGQVFRFFMANLNTTFFLWAIPPCAKNMCLLFFFSSDLARTCYL